jgi:uracil-DNA glycosylase
MLPTTTHKPIMIVGEFPGELEAQTGKPFDGPTGGILFGILRQAGIDPREVHFTNAISERPHGNRFDYFCGPKSEAVANYRPLAPGKFIHRRYQPELDRLFAEIERVKPNVIIALGNLALWALCKKTGIKKYRGSPLPTHDGSAKVIPAWGPLSIQRQWELRVITLADCAKARSESAYPEIKRPEHLIYLEPSVTDIEEFYYTHLVPSPYVSLDIETKMLSITEVGVGTADGAHIMVIPFYHRAAADGNYWKTHAEEAEAWRWVRRICLLPTVGQNFSYDMQYLWRTVRIPCPAFLGDTMLLHHALQPEMEKSLGFLGSIYTNEPSWKFMRTDHSTLKQGDD